MIFRCHALTKVAQVLDRKIEVPETAKEAADWLLFPQTYPRILWTLRFDPTLKSFCAIAKCDRHRCGLALSSAQRLQGYVTPDRGPEQGSQRCNLEGHPLNARL